MPKKLNTALSSALKFITNSNDPYINNTLKRLAKAADDRLIKRAETELRDRDAAAANAAEKTKPSV